MVARQLVLTLVTCCVLAARSLAQGTVSPPPYLDAQETYGLVILIDGAKGDVFRDVAEHGLAGATNLIPNIKKYFIDNGVWVKQATTVFPTITGAGIPSVLTGCYPGRTDIPSLYFFDRSTEEYAILYLFDEAFQWNKWLSTGVRTIWEYFEGADDALAFGPALWRGADVHTSVAWNFKYKPAEFRVGLKAARRSLRRDIVGGLPARLIVAYNGWFDHKEHELGARNPAMVDEYRGMDGLVGEAMSDFLAMVKERQDAGVRVNYYATLVSDHGHKDISDVQSIEKYLATNFHVANVEKEITKLFGQGITGKLPKDLSKFDTLIAAGEGHGLFYFPTNGNFKVKSPLEQLRRYPYRGQVIDIPRVAVQASAVGFLVAKGTDGAVHVYSRVDRNVPGDRAPDEATIERKVIEGRTMYRYQVVAGKDPLGFDQHPSTRNLVSTGFHDSRAWQLGTLDTDYPDGVVQLYQVFDATNRAPDFFLSAYQGVSVGDSVAAGKGSKHGGLTRDESWATLAFFGSGLKQAEVRTARNVDMVPTLLTLMGKDFDVTKLDGEAVPEVVSIVRAARAQSLGSSVGAATNLVELQRHVARLGQVQGDQIYSWVKTFQALADRPMAHPERLAQIRAQVFTALSGRGDAASRRVVQDERAEEFLVRPRPDLPATPAASAAGAADIEVMRGLSRDLADATYQKIFELLGAQFDRLSLQNTPLLSAAEREKIRKAGETVKAEIDANLNLLASLRLAGFDVPAPVLELNMRTNGVNLRYKGLGGASLSAASQTALDTFVRTEGNRAGDGAWYNPVGLGARLLYREAPARFQADVGASGQATVDRVRNATRTTPVDLKALAAGMRPGRVQDLLVGLTNYGLSVDLGSRASGGARVPSAPGPVLTPPRQPDTTPPPVNGAPNYQGLERR